MTNPRRFLLRMAAFLGVVLVIIAVLLPGLEHAFLNNVGLNSSILGILLVGIALNFRHVVQLGHDTRWVDEYRSGRPQTVTSTSGPRLLLPLASMLGERRDRFALSPAVLRSLLDGLASRLEEFARDCPLFYRIDDLPRTAGYLLGVVANRRLDR